MDQPLSQAGFQALHGLGDGGPGQAKLGRGGGEPAGFRHFGEDRPGFEVGKGQGWTVQDGNDDFLSFLFSTVLSSPIFASTQGAKTPHEEFPS